MIGVGADALALVDRPHTPSLTIAAVATIVGWLFHVWSQYATRPDPAHAPDDASDQKPPPIDGRLETPAVVALLTNGFRVPASAITATALDLAARGWLRLAVVDDELVVVTRGQGAAGDSLQPYEQQVLSHLMSRAFNDVSSAGTLAMSQHRLDRRWRNRFGHAVAAHAQEPQKFAIAPFGAINKLLDKAGWTIDEVDLFEVNEAFACVAMFAMRDLGIPHEKVNVHGGATALGHPIGASGTRIITTLIGALKHKGLKKGVATLCIGGGEATAVAIELV